MTRQDAIQKYEKYRGLDPFPEIQSALLNSADVFDYADTIGMVFPLNEDQLNGVTLSLTIGNIAIYWDTDNEKVKVNIEQDGQFTLKSNSIAYVMIAEELRLPAYIIARFNLRVTNAYRGILLGTGPIVDPGFVGKLFIPLHNLTNNDYIFTFGESLIEMEFTKLSPNREWVENIPESEKLVRKGTYKKWKPTFDQVETDKRDIEYYLRRANQGHSIQSSLTPIANEIDASVALVNRSVDLVNSRLNTYNILILLSFIGFLGAAATIVSIFKSDLRDIRNQKLDERVNKIQEHRTSDSSKNLAEINFLKSRLAADSLMIDSLTKKVFK